ncbi:MAG: hypothetical protein AB1641_13310 [Thermodesulfobacteriota bacterium]
MPLEESEIKRLLARYWSAQGECDHYTVLLDEARRKSSEIQQRLLGDGSVEHCAGVIEHLQKAIGEETEAGRRRKLVQLTMLIKSCLEE